MADRVPADEEAAMNPAPNPAAGSSATPECVQCAWLQVQRDKYPSGSAAKNIYEAALSKHRGLYHLEGTQAGWEVK